MATTEQEYHVKWAGADSKNLDDVTTEATSDALNMVGSSGATVVAAGITMKVAGTGTLIAGETVEFYLARSMGDPDADPSSTFEYPTDVTADETLYSQHLATFDLGDDANAVKTVSLPVPLGKCRIYIKATALDAGDDALCSAVIRAILG